MTSRSSRMARAAGIVMVAFVLSRLLGLAREMVIARQFGTSLELAAYLAAFRVPDFIFYLIAGGALGSAFIPTFTEYLTVGTEEEAWQLASAVFNLLALVLTTAAIVAAILAPLLARLIVPGFDPAAQALTARLMRLMLIAPVVFGISGLAMGVLHSHQHFLVPALAPALYNLAIILAALLLGPSMGVRALAVGVVAGALLHLLVQLPMVAHVGARYTPLLGLGHPGVREVARLMGPRILGLAAVQVNFVVNTILASGLGAAALPALNYAWLLMMLPQGVFAMALATVAFPTFSELAARNDAAGLRQTLSATLRTVLYLTVPASVGLLVLRTPVIEVLLQRGAFTQASTDAVAFALQFYALGLFAHATVEIVARAFYALHDTRTPVAIGLGAMLVNVLLSLALIRRLSFGGLALANTLATVGEMAVLMWLMRRRLGSLDVSRLVGSVLRILVAAGLMAAALFSFSRGLPGADPLLVTAGGIIIGVVLYVGITALAGSDEVSAVLRLMERR
ncbi:MAG: murein biosynthesis integral membrane protein MurJ, partial [Anaerolineae bacterium]